MIDHGPGFDITSILDFNSPRYICPACRGLMCTYKTDFKKAAPTKLSCPLCAVKDDVEIGAPSDGEWQVSTHDFKKNELWLDYDDF